MANLQLMLSEEYWQELGADVMMGTLRRLRMDREQKQLDKCVARAMQRTAHYRLHSAHARADAYIWTLDCDPGFAVAGELSRALAAVVNEVRRQSLPHSATIHTDPLRIEIQRREPLPLPLAASWKEISGWKRDQFSFSPGMVPVMGRHHVVKLGLNDPRTAQMLVAGGTGSGKTTMGLNMLTTMGMNTSPALLRFLVIDPKQVDMANSDLAMLPHLVHPIITDTGLAIRALYAAAGTMKRLHDHVTAENAAGRRWQLTNRMVIYVDELAHLVRQEPEIVLPLTWIAEEGRGLGMHLIICTQRPTVDIAPGHLRANLPLRYAGWVRSAEEARIATGLPQSGAETLTGQGHFIQVMRSEMTTLHAYANNPLTDLPPLIADVRKRWGNQRAQLLDFAHNDKAELGQVMEQVEAKVKDDTQMIAAVLAAAQQEGGMGEISLNRISEIGQSVEGAGIGRTRAKRIQDTVRTMLDEQPTESA